MPPLILLLGIDNKLKIFVVAFATFFPVLVNTVYGVKAVRLRSWKLRVLFSADGALPVSGRFARLFAIYQRRHARSVGTGAHRDHCG